MVHKYIPESPIPVLVKQDDNKKYRKNLAKEFTLAPYCGNLFNHILIVYRNTTSDHKEGYSGVNNSKGFDSHWVLDNFLYRTLYGIEEKDIENPHNI